jgi:hypothetical protein
MYPTNWRWWWRWTGGRLWLGTSVQYRRIWSISRRGCSIQCRYAAGPTIQRARRHRNPKMEQMNREVRSQPSKRRRLVQLSQLSVHLQVPHRMFTRQAARAEIPHVICGIDKPNCKCSMMNSRTCGDRWLENLLLWPVFVAPWQKYPFKLTCCIWWYVTSATEGSRYNRFTTKLHWHPLRWPNPCILADMWGP